MSPALKPDNEGAIKAAFDVLDNNKDGVITRDEWLEAYARATGS